jgi:hypothetical protein
MSEHITINTYNAIEIFNTFTLVVMVVLLGTAIYQGYFYDRKCNSWCEKELNGANVEYLMASGVLYNCQIDWSKSTNDSFNFSEELEVIANE